MQCYNNQRDSSSGKPEDEGHQNEKEIYGSLHALAARNAAKQLTKLLSLRPVDLNRTDNDNQTPLHVAAKCNDGSSHFEVTEVLLKHGADPNAKDSCGCTPLWYFLPNCKVDILKLFSKYDTDFAVKTKYGSSSLLVSATQPGVKDAGVLMYLIQDITGLDLDCRGENEDSPVRGDAAAYNKNDSHYEVLEFLLENGADVNARDENGNTPVYNLVKEGENWKFVELLLKHNADVHAVNGDGDNILFAFDSKFSDVQVLDKLINDFGLDVNHQNKEKVTPLRHIITNGFDEAINVKVIKCLVKNGANVNAFGRDGATPLIESVRNLSFERKQFFFENKVYFDFLIELTDFSVVHKHAHIFDHYLFDDLEDDDEDYYYDAPRLNYYCEWILKHLAKLKFLKVSIHPVVLKFIQNHTDFKDYFEKCTQELEVMVTTKPQNCWINFFNLLVDDRRKLKNYAANESLIKECENKYFLKKFPIYGALVQKNIKKGLKRRELFNKSSISLSNCLPIFNSNHLIVTDILDCILSKKNLSKLC